jgi:hypothetical protein
MSSPESGYIVLEFIRGPEVDEPEQVDDEAAAVDSYRDFTLNHILTRAQAIFRMHIVKHP